MQLNNETENAMLFIEYLMVESFQTLLHEMIHALLFVTHNYKDRESHGPEFCKHMRRINLLTGANVTVRIILFTFFNRTFFLICCFS